MNPVCTFAHTNIALIKYWGKLEHPLNLPATGSLSLTLDRFGTKTKLSFHDQKQDTFTLNGQIQTGEPLNRVQKFLDHVRTQVRSTQHCHVESQNHVPTQSGLASSASGFASLALAANHLFELELSPADLSRLARIGSGSAARSVFGGFVLMHKKGAFAEALNPHPALDVKLIVVQCHQGQKAISSREGMLRTAQTSPYYPAWVETHPEDLKTAQEALEKGDLKTLGEVTEHSTLKMHASMLAAKPGFCYLNPVSLDVIQKIKQLRHEQNLSCYFTLDAGPHVKILCPSDQADTIVQSLFSISGIVSVDVAGPGPGATIL